MLEISSLKPQQCIYWKESFCEIVYDYTAVITKASEHAIECVELRSAERGVHCYDEGGSNPSTEADNVRFRKDPPPLEVLYLKGAANGYCYAIADGVHTRIFGQDDMEGKVLVDGGALTGQRLLDEIASHPWRDEKQRVLQPWMDYGQADSYLAELERQEQDTAGWGISLLGAVATAPDAKPEPPRSQSPDLKLPDTSWMDFRQRSQDGPDYPGS